MNKIPELSDEQIWQAWDNALDEEVHFDHKPTTEDVLMIRLKSVLKAQRELALMEEK